LASTSSSARPTNDTAADPVVRVTIAEIRKRIAQYYLDEAHDAEIRIELLPGCYAPQFRLRRDLVLDRPVATPDHPPDHHPSRPATSSAYPRARKVCWSTILPALAVVLAIVVFSSSLRRLLQPSALDQFWGPLFAGQHTIFVCIPQSIHANDQPAANNLDPLSPLESEHSPNLRRTFSDYQAMGENVVYSDMLSTIEIANLLALHHRDYRVRLTSSTTLDDLRQGPAILVGAWDNEWTMRATANLRYHFAGTVADGFWIADSQDPGNRTWSLDLKTEVHLRHQGLCHRGPSP
jgi:hypothetical protein